MQPNCFGCAFSTNRCEPIKDFGVFQIFCSWMPIELNFVVVTLCPRRFYLNLGWKKFFWSFSFSSNLSLPFFLKFFLTTCLALTVPTVGKTINFWSVALLSCLSFFKHMTIFSLTSPFHQKFMAIPPWTHLLA